MTPSAPAPLRCSSVCTGTLLLLCAILQIHAQAPVTTAHQAPDPSRVSALGHKLLEAAVKVNGLSGADLKPWHMKAEFQMLSGTDTKPKSGTLEEWYQSRYQWRRTYAGAESYWNGTEWRTSKTERSISNPRHNRFDRDWMNLRVGRPILDPLYQVGNIQPDQELKVERLSANGTTLNCTSLAHPSEEEFGKKPEWIVPMMCFDSDLHLRMIHSEETIVQFDDIQQFQGRAVGRDVKIVYEGRISAEMKITQLEPYRLLTLPSCGQRIRSNSSRMKSNPAIHSRNPSTKLAQSSHSYRGHRSPSAACSWYPS